jgi:hypoxanthine-DNA glycosylase
MFLIHPFEPYIQKNSRILILGSFPSVKSREISFYYGHPQNRFWRVLSTVFKMPVPVTEADKRGFLLQNKIALWDVLKSCDITGSADSSIKNAEVNDINSLVKNSEIQKILINGTTAYKLYKRYAKIKPHLETICLPSTSPANAQYSLDRLINIWREHLLLVNTAKK